MSNNISERDLPYGVHYQIHSHNGLQGKEREAHVHFHGKECNCKYSLITNSYIEGSLGPASDSQLQKWISDNKYELIDEWEKADSPKGGRN